MAVQDYIDHVLNALPRWFSRPERTFENIKAFAEMFQDVEDQIVFWRSQANILDAVGAVTGEPDWLQQHAVDRGTRRQEGETDAALRDRLRSFPDALHRNALLTAAQSIVDATGVVGTVVMLELRRDRGHFGKYSSDTGTGGTFAALTGTEFSFTPDTPFASPLEVNFPGSGDRGNPQLVVSGANSGGNDGTFPVLRLEGSAVVFDNATGVAEADPTATWTLQKRETNGNVIDGFDRAYFGRGYRMAANHQTAFVMILPFGTTEATRLAVLEMLRQKKGAGVLAIVERRQSP